MHYVKCVCVCVFVAYIASLYLQKMVVRLQYITLTDNFSKQRWTKNSQTTRYSHSALTYHTRPKINRFYSCNYTESWDISIINERIAWVKVLFIGDKLLKWVKTISEGDTRSDGINKECTWCLWSRSVVHRGASHYPDALFAALSHSLDGASADSRTRRAWAKQEASLPPTSCSVKNLFYFYLFN